MHDWSNGLSDHICRHACAARPSHLASPIDHQKVSHISLLSADKAAQRPEDVPG